MRSIANTLRILYLYRKIADYGNGVSKEIAVFCVRAAVDALRDIEGIFGGSGSRDRYQQPL